MELPVHKFQSLAHAHMAGKWRIGAFFQDLLPQRLRNYDLLLTPIILVIRRDGVR